MRERERERNRREANRVQCEVKEEERKQQTAAGTRSFQYFILSLVYIRFELVYISFREAQGGSIILGAHLRLRPFLGQNDFSINENSESTWAYFRPWVVDDAIVSLHVSIYVCVRACVCCCFLQVKKQTTKLGKKVWRHYLLILLNTLSIYNYVFPSQISLTNKSRK